MIDVRCEVEACEEEGKEVRGNTIPRILIKNHEEWSEWVEIWLDNKSYTFVGNELITAIENAMRSGE